MHIPQISGLLDLKFESKNSLRQAQRLSSLAKLLVSSAVIIVLMGLATLAFAPGNRAFGHASGAVASCELANANLIEAKSWLNRYQPLASRGGVYRKAYDQAMLDTESALSAVSTSCRD